MTKKAYDDFYEWFNKCPVPIRKHDDHVDTLDVTFAIPYCDDEEDNSLRQEEINHPEETVHGRAFIKNFDD